MTATSRGGTEALFEAAFSTKALITAGEAARLLGLDDKAFRYLVTAGAIRSVMVSPTTRRYAEADLRAFLAGETAMPPPAPPRGRVTVSTRRKSKPMGFLEAYELHKTERSKPKPKKDG